MNQWFDRVLASYQGRYNSHLHEVRPAKPEHAGLAIKETLQLENCSDVWEAFKPYKGTGWLLTMDNVLYSWDGHSTEDMPLRAELVSDDLTLVLRRTDSDWRIDKIHRIQDAEQRIFIEKYARRPQGQLHYEIAWRNDHGRWRPWLSRLCAVDPGDKTGKE